MPSNESGIYTFTALPPGPYIVKSELQGFKTVKQKVDLHVEQTVRVNFTMEIGTLSETAEVTGVAPLITTENATVGTVIENRRIVELPLNGRNFLSLVALSPNVSAEFATAGQAGDRQGGSRANQQLSISGQRREFNYYTLDGTDNTDVNFNTYILLPSVDALEEFKVQTGIYSAEFGRAASQVNVVTKSGTNQFHGTVFEFHRNDSFDSRPFSFSAAQAACRSPRSSGTSTATPLAARFGATRCSSCRTGRGTATASRISRTTHLPLAAWRTGDFSSYSGVLYDPATCTVSGTTRSCATFPGNRIPASRIHPTSVKLLEFYPSPNATGTDATGTVNNYTGDSGSHDRQRPVHAAHRLRAELVVDLDGPVQPQPRRRNPASIEVERLEAGQPDSSGDGRQHADALADRRQRIPVWIQLVLQHVRARAGFRARRHRGAGHPRHESPSGNSLGHSEHYCQRAERLWRQHRGAVHQQE